MTRMEHTVEMDAEVELSIHAERVKRKEFRSGSVRAMSVMLVCFVVIERPVKKLGRDQTRRLKMIPLDGLSNLFPKRNSSCTDLTV